MRPLYQNTTEICLSSWPTPQIDDALYGKMKARLGPSQRFMGIRERLAIFADAVHVREPVEMMFLIHAVSSCSLQARSTQSVRTFSKLTPQHSRGGRLPSARPFGLACWYLTNAEAAARTSFNRSEPRSRRLSPASTMIVR